MLRYILCPHWHWMRLVNTRWDKFCVLADMGGVWSTEIEMHFIFSLACDRLGDTCWDAYHVFAGMKYVLTTQVEVHFLFSLAWDDLGQQMLKIRFMSLLAWDVFGQYKLRHILFLCWHGIGLLNTCWDTFCFLACMGGVRSTHVEINFMPSLAWDGFNQYKLWCILFRRCKGAVWPKQVKGNFVSCLAWDRFSNYKFCYILCPRSHGRGFGEHMLKCILCPRGHGICLVNLCLDPFCGLAGMGGVWSTQAEMHSLSWLSCDGFVNTSYDTFCVSQAWDGFGQHMLRYFLWLCCLGMDLINIWVLAVMGGLWSTKVVIHFVSSLAWERFSQHRLRYFCVFASIGGVWSTYFEINFVSSLTWDRFGQQMLRCILYPCWHGRGFVNTSCDTFCVLASKGGVWSIHVEIHFVSSLA